MITFYLAAAALVVVALVLLLRPWWRTGHGAVGGSALPALNAAIHRDRLAELERDRNNGTVSATDFAEAQEELQRQLLDDTAAVEAAAPGGTGRNSGIVLAILLPLLAVGLYALLGSPTAVLPAAVQTQRATADMEQLAAKLASKLEQNPDNVVFIFARAVNGPRMPLAAQRARVADLPMDFMLDDSQAVMQGATISSVDSVRVEVRVSKSGTANPGKGDLTGKSDPVKPGAKGLKIVIDQVNP